MQEGGFPRWHSGKESTCNAGDTSSIPRLGRFPGVENGNPLQHPCLGNPMDRGTWWATVHNVARVRHNWATEHPCMQDETGRRKGGRGCTLATSAFSAGKPHRDALGFPLVVSQHPGALWMSRGRMCALDFCLCRPLSHGVLLGPSFTAAHGVTPAS